MEDELRSSGDERRSPPRVLRRLPKRADLASPRGLSVELSEAEAAAARAQEEAAAAQKALEDFWAAPATAAAAAPSPQKPMPRLLATKQAKQQASNSGNKEQANKSGSNVGAPPASQSVLSKALALRMKAKASAQGQSGAGAEAAKKQEAVKSDKFVAPWAQRANAIRSVWARVQAQEAAAIQETIPEEQLKKEGNALGVESNEADGTSSEEEGVVVVRRLGGDLDVCESLDEDGLAHPEVLLPEAAGNEDRDTVEEPAHVAGQSFGVSEALIAAQAAAEAEVQAELEAEAAAAAAAERQDLDASERREVETRYEDLVRASCFSF